MQTRIDAVRIFRRNEFGNLEGDCRVLNGKFREPQMLQRCERFNGSAHRTAFPAAGSSLEGHFACK
jgi:hypothetical protein